MLKIALGRDGLNVFKGLKEPKDTYEDAFARLSEYFVGSTNILLARRDFYSCKQNPDETIHNFECRVRRLAQECQFPDCSMMMRDIFVLGIRDDRLGCRLLAEDVAALTFDKAVNIASNLEKAYTDRCKVKDSDASGNVNALSNGRYNSNSNSNRQTSQNNKNFHQNDKKCNRCGNKWHKSLNDCPALKSKCRSCGKEGHWDKMCRSKSKNTNDDKNSSDSKKTFNKKRNANLVDDCSDNESNISYCDIGFSVQSINSLSSKLPTVNLSIDGKMLCCIPDSGASVNVLPAKLFPRVKWKKTSMKLRTYGGSTLPIVGSAYFMVSYQGKSVNSCFYGVDLNNERPLLSLELCSKLNILDSHVNNINLNDDIFEGLGNMKNIRFHIKLKPGAETRYAPARRLAPTVKDAVKKQIDSLLEQNVIVPVDYSEWASPIVPVMKKNGDVRVCVDFRYLNKCILREHYQMPTLEELLSKINGATVYSSLDARSGYHQIPVEDESQKYLVFSTPFGNFKYVRLPFGIASAPEIFQKAMNHILVGLPGVVCYLDDVLIFGKTKKEHDDHLERVMNRIRKYGMKLNKEKCQFGLGEIKFLGHILNKDGIKPDPAKQNAIREFKEPKSIQEARSFLGLASYIGQRFVKNYSTLSKPIWDTIHNENFTWTEETTKAFDELKNTLASSLNLKYFDMNEKSILKVDASGIGIGGALEQNGKPVIFVSRKLSNVEQRYAQIEREFLSIVFACHRLRSFLLGRKFEIHTDNSPLISFFKKPLEQVPLRIQRWILSLQAFDFEIKHVKGKENVIADTLSRFPSSTTESCELEMSNDWVILNISAELVNIPDIENQNVDDDEFKTLSKLINKNWNIPKDTCGDVYNQFSFITRFSFIQ